MNINQLFLNWQQLLKSMEINDAIAIKKTFTLIVDNYSIKSRYYHNLEHIKQVIKTIELLQYNTNFYPAIHFAAWFHDIIYDSQAKDNEERSAEYGRKLLIDLNIPDAIIDNTCRLILNTKHHQAEINDFESHVLLDTDLSILGSNSETYHNYSKAIRQEYAWVSDDDYIAGRKAVLESFLQRRIFFTDDLFNRLELTARENIQNEIRYLERQGNKQ
jgi:predicted metal-dependent HD superfamily phosphohydrolase